MKICYLFIFNVFENNLLTSKVVISLIEFLPHEAPLEDDPEL